MNESSTKQFGNKDKPKIAFRGKDREVLTTSGTSDICIGKTVNVMTPT
jgi:hypothetical protein